MIKRLSMGVVVLVGVVWILATVILGLWGKSAAADRLTADLEPAFSKSEAAQARADSDAVAAFTAELQEVTIPFLATQLGITREEVTQTLSSGYPDVGALLSTTGNDGKEFPDGRPYVEHASGYLDTVVSAIESDRTDFSKASDIPASWLPTRALPVLFVVLGLAALVLSWLALSRPDEARRLGGAVAALGVVVVAVTVVLNVPGKTDALENVTDDFRPVYAADGSLSITEGAQYLAAVRAAEEQLQGEVLPALPDLLQLSPAALATALQDNSPVVATALLEADPGNPEVSVLAGIVDRYDALAATVIDTTGDFRSTDKIPGLGWPATAVTWLLVVPALLLIVAGAAVATASQGSRAQPSRVSQGREVSALPN